MALPLPSRPTSSRDPEFAHALRRVVGQIPEEPRAPLKDKKRRGDRSPPLFASAADYFFFAFFFGAAFFIALSPLLCTLGVIRRRSA
jgi:hypothetical protein